MRKKLMHSLIFFSALLLLFSSCAKRQNPEQATPNTPPSTEIRTAVVRESTLQKKVALAGQISLTETGRADITAPLSGIVVRPLVKVGDSAVKGAPVALVNTIYGQTSLQIIQKLEADKAAFSQAQDNARQTQAELRNATLDYERKQNLFKAGVVSHSDLFDAESRYQKAKSSANNTKTLLEIAGVNLSRDRAILSQSGISGASIPNSLAPAPPQSPEDGKPRLNQETARGFVSFYVRSPINGTVTAVNATPGFSVSPGTVLASVVNTERVYMDANAYESDLPFIHQGDRAVVEVPAFPNRKFLGTVSYVGKVVDPNTRTVLVRSLLENSSGILRGGMFVNANLTSSRPNHVVVIPESALLAKGQENYVYIETSPSHYEKRDVTAGLVSDGSVEIRQGLKAGEKVVTRGALLLDGSGD